PPRVRAQAAGVVVGGLEELVGPVLRIAVPLLARDLARLAPDADRGVREEALAVVRLRAPARVLGGLTQAVRGERLLQRVLGPGRGLREGLASDLRRHRSPSVSSYASLRTASSVSPAGPSADSPAGPSATASAPGRVSTRAVRSSVCLWVVGDGCPARRKSAPATIGVSHVQPGPWGPS